MYLGIYSTFWQHWWNNQCRGIAWRAHSYYHQTSPWGNRFSVQTSTIHLSTHSPFLFIGLLPWLCSRVITFLWFQDTNPTHKLQVPMWIHVGIHSRIPVGVGAGSPWAGSLYWRTTWAPSSGSSYLCTRLRGFHCNIRRRFKKIIHKGWHDKLHNKNYIIKTNAISVSGNNYRSSFPEHISCEWFVLMLACQL